MNWVLYWTLLLQIALALFVIAIPTSFFLWMVGVRPREKKPESKKII